VVRPRLTSGSQSPPFRTDGRAIRLPRIPNVSWRRRSRHRLSSARRDRRRRVQRPGEARAQRHHQIEQLPLLRPFELPAESARPLNQARFAGAGRDQLRIGSALDSGPPASTVAQIAFICRALAGYRTPRYLASAPFNPHSLLPSGRRFSTTGSFTYRTRATSSRRLPSARRVRQAKDSLHYGEICIATQSCR